MPFDDLDFVPSLIESLWGQRIMEGELYGPNSLFSGDVGFAMEGQPVQGGAGSPRYITGQEAQAIANLMPRSLAPETPKAPPSPEEDPERIKKAIARYEQTMGVKWSEGNDAWLRSKTEEVSKWLEKWSQVEGE